MGPRKTLASKGKRVDVGSSAERRSKSREEESTRQPAAPPPAPIISMLNRQVTTGRKVYFDFLEEENFRIGGLIRAQGWEKFCSLEEPVYPRLVRIFFENLTVGTPQFVSTVKGTRILLDENRICRLLDMPNNGICHLNLKNKMEALKVVLEDENTVDIRNLQANRLSVEMRLLHHIVSRIFFPKTGRFDWVTEKDIEFIHNLVKNKPMNLPYMMMAQIKEAAKKQKACLPYGMVFTLLFREFGIDCTGEDAKKLRHTDRYNVSSLHRMGYIKMNGRWIKKSSEQEAASSDDSDEEEEAPQEAGVSAQPPSPRSPPAPAPPASSSAQASQPAGLSSEQMDQISFLISSQIQGAKEEIFQRIDSLREEISDSFREIRRNLSARAAPTSPQISFSAVAVSSNPVDVPDPRDPVATTRTYTRMARRPPPPPAGPATRTRSQASRRSESKGETADVSSHP